MQNSDISKFESDVNSVTITLKSGVTIRLDSNDGYVHISMCGIDGKIEVDQRSRAANYINLKYQKAEWTKGE